MPAEIFLIAPQDADPARFPDQLRAVLAAGSCPALLVPRGNATENAYKSLVKAIVPVAQSAGSAVLVEGEPGLVRMLGADGLHAAGGQDAVREALDVLKPQMIVGAAGARTRHDAMSLGELEVDYLFFGGLGETSDKDRELAAWWAETMGIPAVLGAAQSPLDALDPMGCEFIALGDNLWNAAEGAETALAAALARLETL